MAGGHITDVILPGASLTPEAALTLQRSAGNRAVARFIAGRRRLPGEPTGKPGTGGPPPFRDPTDRGPRAQGRATQAGGRQLQRAPTLDDARIQDPFAPQPDDGLYLIEIDYQGIPYPYRQSLMTGKNLEDWAVEKGFQLLTMGYVRGEAERLEAETVKTMQETDDVTSRVLDQVWPHLQARVLGTEGPFNSGLDPALWGSHAARTRALEDLRTMWGKGGQGPAGVRLRDRLLELYIDRLAEAEARKPSAAIEVVVDPSEYRRIRHTPCGHQYFNMTRGDVIARGRSRGKKTFVDVCLDSYNPKVGPVAGVGGSVWYHLDGYPLWYYREYAGTLGDTMVDEVAYRVYKDAQFAGLFWPWLLKMASYGLNLVAPESFAARIAVDIVAIVIQDMGEQGEAEVKGEKGPSLKEMIAGAGFQIVVNRIFERVVGGGGRQLKGVDPGRLGEFEAKAATAVRNRLVEAEGPKVASAIRAGRVTKVRDPKLIEEGFDTEVKIENHQYLGKKDGTWCRHSDPKICDLTLGKEAAEVRKQFLKTARDAPVPHPKMGLPSKTLDDLEKGLEKRLSAIAVGNKSNAKYQDLMQAFNEGRVADGPAEKFVREHAPEVAGITGSHEMVRGEIRELWTGAADRGVTVEDELLRKLGVSRKEELFQLRGGKSTYPKFHEAIQQERPFYDLAFEADIHGPYPHAFQWLMLDEHLGPGFTKRLWQAIADMEGKPRGSIPIWSVAFDAMFDAPIESNLLNAPEVLGRVLHDVLGLPGGPKMR